MAAAAPNSVLEKKGVVASNGYMALSGTSMAAPHVSGAAALLAQQHPAWGGEEIKAALVASAQPNGQLTANQQGTGQIDLAAAVEQTVTVEPSSLNFGFTQWPHADDQPVTRSLTYRNLGSEDVTLKLAATGADPRGGAVPETMFTLSRQEMTVPAGGTTSVDVTADSTVPSLTGTFTVNLTATGEGGQHVRTTGVIELQVETYNLAMTALDRNGQAPRG